MLSLLVAPAAATAEPHDGARGPVVAGELLLRWAATSTADERAEVRQRHGLTRANPIAGAIEHVRFRGAGDPSVLAAALARNPHVVYAEPNAVLEPADTYDHLLWGLDNVGQLINGVSGTPDVDVDAPEAWALTTGRASTVVAIIDSGVQIDHPDLIDNIWTNTAESRGLPGVDDDGNGYVDDVNGWDFVHNDSSVYDDSEEDLHGTHIAGTIAAGANGFGIRGVAPNVSIMPLKFMGSGEGSTADAISAIQYAVAKGADVINASWGSPDSSLALRDTIAAAGIPFVAAAGNGGDDGVGDDLDRAPVFPAAWDLPNLVSVAAIDNRGAMAGFSNYGKTTVDVGAPGVLVGGTLTGGEYGYLSGTSMAAPFVSGIAALLDSHDSSLSGAQIVDRIVATAVPLASLENRTRSGGLVNAAAALTGTSSTSGDGGIGGSTSDGGTSTAGGGEVDVNGSVTTDLDGDGASVDRPLEATLSGADTDAAVADATVSSSPDDFLLLGPAVDVDLGSTAATLEVRIDASLHRAVDRQAILVFLGGTPLLPCDGSSASCITATTSDGDDLVVTIDLATSGTVSVGLPTVACPDVLAEPLSFPDVTGGVHADAIGCIGWWDITRGTATGEYQPAQSVNRAQMATFLAAVLRGAGLQAADRTDYFTDDNGTAHEANINLLASLGIVNGTGDGKYSPSAPVTRAQMATFLVGTHAAITGLTTTSTTNYFPDDDGNPHEANIDALAELGITSGTGDGRYDPSGLVRRDQMASFIRNLIDGLASEGYLPLP